MDYEIVWTNPALEDLEELVRFIAADDPAAAISVGDRIIEHVEILQSFPEIGPVFRQRTTGAVRQIICRPFRIFYRVNQSSQQVEVLHVWHGARRDPTDLK